MFRKSFDHDNVKYALVGNQLCKIRIVLFWLYHIKLYNSDTKWYNAEIPFISRWTWGCDRRACWHLQLWRACGKQAFTTFTVTKYWWCYRLLTALVGIPARPDMGHLLRHPLLHPHLGGGALAWRASLNRDASLVSVESILHLWLHDLLRPARR